eukprot:1291790-Amphidinium_carterae.1
MGAKAILGSKCIAKTPVTRLRADSHTHTDTQKKNLELQATPRYTAQTIKQSGPNGCVLQLRRRSEDNAWILLAVRA